MFFKLRFLEFSHEHMYGCSALNYSEKPKFYIFDCILDPAPVVVLLLIFVTSPKLHNSATRLFSPDMLVFGMGWLLAFLDKQRNIGRSPTYPVLKFIKKKNKIQRKRRGHKTILLKK